MVNLQYQGKFMKADVTIIMVVRNEEDYVGETIKSILDQSYKDFVFLILDDGSTDNTWKVIQSFKDERIQAKHFTERSYLTKRLNEGLRMTRTIFVARMDSHNIADKRRLEKQRDFMLAHPEVALVGCNFTRTDEKGKVILKSNLTLTDRDIKNHILEKNQFKHACWFARYEILKKEGFYNESFRFSQDYEFLLRLVAKYPVANLPDSLLQEKQIKKAMSQQHRLEQASLVLKAQLQAMFRGDYPLWQAIYLLRTVGYVINSARYQFAYRHDIKDR